MSIRIASTIFKSRLSLAGTWVVSTAATDPDALPADRYVLGTCGMASTFSEAIELAHAQRAELARELMDALHAERTGRRDVHTLEPTA